MAPSRKPGPFGMDDGWGSNVSRMVREGLRCDNTGGCGLYPPGPVGTPPIVRNLRRYDRAAAARYVWKYGLHYNPAFPNLSGAALQGAGGDCTNFVSQALLAGGWTMIPGRCHDTDSWWYEGKPTGSWWEHWISGYASSSWVFAKSFYEFLAASRRVSRCQESELTVGDIVQGRDAEFNRLEHTMIVTTKRYGDVGVSYHTRDVLDASLDMTKKRFSEIVCWKVADVFSDLSPLFQGAALLVI